jgi:hypothetical protein
MREVLAASSRIAPNHPQVDNSARVDRAISKPSFTSAVLTVTRTAK